MPDVRQWHRIALEVVPGKIFYSRHNCHLWTGAKSDIMGRRCFIGDMRFDVLADELITHDSLDFYP